MFLSVGFLWTPVRSFFNFFLSHSGSTSARRCLVPQLRGFHTESLPLLTHGFSSPPPKNRLSFLHLDYYFSFPPGDDGKLFPASRGALLLKLAGCWGPDSDHSSYFETILAYLFFYFLDVKTSSTPPPSLLDVSPSSSPPLVFNFFLFLTACLCCTSWGCVVDCYCSFSSKSSRLPRWLRPVGVDCLCWMHVAWQQAAWPNIDPGFIYLYIYLHHFAPLLPLTCLLPRFLPVRARQSAAAQHLRRITAIIENTYKKDCSRNDQRNKRSSGNLCNSQCIMTDNTRVPAFTFTL